MTTRLITVLIAFILAACGASGLPLENFPALSKVEGDAPFTLTAPTSESSGAFTYTSSDTAVATISGDVVTILSAGTTKITVTQAAKDSYKSSTTTAILTVSPIQCPPPAIRSTGVCIAPPATGNFVTRSERSWMPASFIGTWSQANTYCMATSINGMKGWRLPTEFELTDLFLSGAIINQGWSLSRTWSSTTGATAVPNITVQGMRKTVRLDNGTVTDELETNSAYVACIR